MDCLLLRCKNETNWMTIVWLAHVRPEANPRPHSQILLHAADKSRTRDFLFLAQALTAVTVHFPQLPYPVAWGQYCRLSLLSMPCASPFEKWTSQKFLHLTGEVWCLPPRAVWGH